MTRKPLVPMSPEERQRDNERRNLTDENLPRGLTGAERQAALGLTDEEVKAMAETTVPEKSSPLALPPAVVLTAKVVATICGSVMLLLPAIAGLPVWLPMAVFVLGVVASLLAGLALPSPFKGKPVLSGTAATVGGGAAALAVQVSSSFPEGSFAQQATLASVLVLSALTGAAIPFPVKK